MLTFVAVVATLNLLVAVADLYVDLRHARPVRRRDAVRQAAEHGVAYAEQLGRRRSETTGPEKFQHALAVARDELSSLKVRFTEAEVGRAIEVAIGSKKT